MGREEGVRARAWNSTRTDNVKVKIEKRDSIRDGGMSIQKKE